MAYLKFNKTNSNLVSVPSWFITDYMPRASCGHLKVYLYLLFASTNSNPDLTLAEVASKLDMLYSEVIAALKFWDNEGVISFKEASSTSDDHEELTFYMEKPIQSSDKEPQANRPIAKTFINQTRPNYSPAELNIYKQEEKSISHLFCLAEEYLGKLLSPSDQQILFGLYDWLHLPLELIEYILEFCASNNHTNLRYIEKVAISWVDSGITTLDAAKNKTNYDKRYTKILAELGLSSQIITKVQKEFIDKWLNAYNFSMEIILEACKRTIAQTKNPSLKYVDSILTSWSKTNAKTLSDVEDLDKAYITKTSNKVSTAPSRQQKATKNQRFTNIYTHDWDFDQLELLEQQYIDHKLQGGK